MLDVVDDENVPSADVDEEDKGGVLSFFCLLGLFVSWLSTELSEVSSRSRFGCEGGCVWFIVLFGTELEEVAATLPGLVVFVCFTGLVLQAA